MLGFLQFESQRWTGIPLTWLLLGISIWYAPLLLKHCSACTVLYLLWLLLILTVFMSPETAVKSPWRELFSKTLFQQRAVMVAIDEVHCIHEWLEHAYFITLNTWLHVPHCIVQGTWLPDGIPQDWWIKGPHKNSIHVPYCFSISSNRVGDCRFSRVHKSRFCEEAHQPTQYLLLCHKEVKYASKYMYSISPVTHLYKFACVACRKILIALPCTIKNPKVYPKLLSFVRQRV